MATPTVPTGSYIFYESFSSLLSVLGPEDELAVRRAMDAFVFGGDMPDLSPMATAIFQGITPQLAANVKKRENGKKGGRPRKTDGTVRTEPFDNDSENVGFAQAKTTGFDIEKTTGSEKTKPNVNVNANENVNVNGNRDGGNPQTPFAADAAAPDTDNPLLFETQTIAPPEEPAPKPKSKRFVPPTVDQVREYAAEYAVKWREKYGIEMPHFDPERFVDWFSANGWRLGKGNTPMKDWQATVRNWIWRDADNRGPAQVSRASPTAPSTAPKGPGPNTTPVQFPPGTKLREKYPREKFTHMSDEEYERKLRMTQELHGGEL